MRERNIYSLLRNIEISQQNSSASFAKMNSSIVTYGEENISSIYLNSDTKTVQKKRKKKKRLTKTKIPNQKQNT